MRTLHGHLQDQKTLGSRLGSLPHKWDADLKGDLVLFRRSRERASLGTTVPAPAIPDIGRRGIAMRALFLDLENLAFLADSLATCHLLAALQHHRLSFVRTALPTLNGRVGRHTTLQAT